MKADPGVAGSTVQRKRESQSWTGTTWDAGPVEDSEHGAGSSEHQADGGESLHLPVDGGNLRWAGRGGTKGWGPWAQSR